MKRLLLLIILAFEASHAWAEYVDAQAIEDHASRLEIIKKGREACKGKDLKTVGEIEACMDEFKDKARKLYPTRGTSEYAEKKYSGLSKDEAELKLIELQKNYQEAKGGLFYRPMRDPGVIPNGVLLEEGWWIQKHVFGIPEAIDGDPWFRECDDAPYVEGKTFFKTCPLGKGGAE